VASKGAKRWVRSKADESAVAEGCYFDLAAAERVRGFFRGFLRHSKGEWAGKSFELLDWQWAGVVAPLFGWRRADGTRRYRRAGIWVPKKNGKSSLCSAIALYLLVADGEAGAEVYSAAADRDQAAIVYREAAAMVKASPELSGRVECLDASKVLRFAAKNAVYKALSAEAPTKEGLNAHGLIFDELHAQKSRELWDCLAYAGAARRQPLFISISTAGYDRDSIGYEQYRYAKAVLDGTVEDSAFFAFVAEAAEGDDWADPAVWRKANPSFGVTVKADQFESDYKEAKASPAKENAFRRYRLNQWTEQSTRWLALDRWDACSAPVDPGALAGRACYAGLDLASTTDLAALVLIFPSADGSYDVLPYFWAPQEACRRRERQNKARLDAWARAGHVELTPGDVIDYDVIRAKVNALQQVYDVKEVAIDPWNATHLSTQLMGDGFSVVAFRQGFGSMTAPTKELEKLVLAGALRHGGHPVLRWNASNVAVRTDAAGNLKPDKERSGDKIDGICALVMALGRAMLAPPAADLIVEVW
jgi:phage terminase large subunit-like protein